MKKINLGCGSDILDGYENYDKYPIDSRVKYIELNILPLPFDDNSVDEIVLNQTLEHLDVNPYSFIMDCYRILKKDGTLKVSLPVFYASVTHNRFYHSSGYFDVLTYKDDRVSDVYANDFFKVVSFKRHFRGFRNGLAKLIDFVFSLFFDEYSWELKKK